MDEPISVPTPSRRPRRRGLGYGIAALCVIILAIYLYLTLPYYAYIDGRAQWFAVIGVVVSCGWLAVTVEREWRKAAVAGVGLFGVSGVLFILSMLFG